MADRNAHSGITALKSTAVRLLLLAAAVLTVAALAAGCGKSEEEKRIEAAREWTIENYSEGKTPPPKPKPLPPDLVIEVPDSVKARYTGVVMGLGNRATDEVVKFNVKIGETADVPGTDYTIKVAAYLPTWVLKGKVATSRKDEPTDPAVRATIYKSGEQVFDGFIFQKHKTPSFITDDYVIGLVDAIEK